MQDDQATGATRCFTCGATDGFTKRPRLSAQNGNPAANRVGAAPAEKLFTWRCGRCGIEQRDAADDLSAIGDDDFILVPPRRCGLE